MIVIHNGAFRDADVRSGTEAGVELAGGYGGLSERGEAGGPTAVPPAHRPSTGEGCAVWLRSGPRLRRLRPGWCRTARSRPSPARGRRPDSTVPRRRSRCGRRPRREATTPYPSSSTPSEGGQNRPMEPTTIPVSRSMISRWPKLPSRAGLSPRRPAMTLSPSEGKSSAQSARRTLPSLWRTARASDAVQVRRQSRSVVSSERSSEEEECTCDSWSWERPGPRCVAPARGPEEGVPRKAADGHIHQPPCTRAVFTRLPRRGDRSRPGAEPQAQAGLRRCLPMAGRACARSSRPWIGPPNLGASSPAGG